MARSSRSTVAGWRASRWLLCVALLCAALNAPAAEPRKVFIVGDSTASLYRAYAEAGLKLLGKYKILCQCQGMHYFR